MSLHTLLEAARYIEWTATPSTKTRAEEAQEFHPYAKNASNHNEKKNGVQTDKNDPTLSGSDDSSKDGRKRAGGAGTREVHNKLEKNRRAHLKECFENLKACIPNLDDKKVSNLHILRSSLRFIQTVKRKEKEFEQEMQRLAREKIIAQEKIAQLKRELAQMNVDIDINHFMSNKDGDSHSTTSTATAENDGPIVSDEEEDMSNAAKPTIITQKSITARPNAIAMGSAMIIAPPSSMSMGDQKITVQKLLSSTGATNVQTLTAARNSSNLSIPTTRPPVAQILQQTLAQRAIQHQLAQQQILKPHTAIPSQNQSNAVLNSIRAQMSAMKPIQQIPQGLTIGPLVPSLTPSGGSILTAGSTGQLSVSSANALAAISRIVSSAGPAVSVKGESIGIHQGSIATNRILKTEPGTMVHIAPSSTHATPTAVTAVTAVTQVNPPLTFATMKHIITAPITHIPGHIITPSQMSGTIGQFVTPRNTTVGQLVTSTASIPGQVMSPSVINSLGQTQLMTPISMMPPIQMNPGQLTGVVSPHMIKSLGQFPTILQQPISLPHIMKPMVMVAQTVPNVMSTTTAPQTVQVTVPVTHPS